MSLNQAQSPSRRLEPGSTFDERYSVISHIGSGGMANVYKVRHQHLDQLMALKLLRRDMCNDPRKVKRFKQEATTVARVKHPNLVNVHGFGIVDGTPYLCMEYVEGDSLDMILDADGPLPQARVVLAGKQIAAALGFLHEHGIVHRDVKPSNVIGTADGVFKLADFGLAKLTIATDADTDSESGDTSPQSLTQTGAVIGTPAYMSPEQSTGGAVDSRSDIYSLGCLLFELSTGKPPFEAQSHYEMLAQHLKAPVPSISDTAGTRFDNVRLDQLVQKCLAKDPAARPQTMSEVVAELEECQSAPAETMPAWRKGVRAARRKLRFGKAQLNTSMAVILAVQVVAIAVLTTVRLHQPEAVQSEDVSVEQLLTQGREQLNGGHPEDALRFFLPAYRRVENLEGSERKAECAMWVGIAYTGSRRPAEALRYFDESASIYKHLGEKDHEGEVRYKKGAALMLMEEWEKAVTALEVARKVPYEGADVNCALGTALLQSGRFDEIGGQPYAWEQPGDAKPRAGYSWQGKPAGALHFLKLAFDQTAGGGSGMQETRSSAASMLALTLMHLGRTAEAKKYIQPALEYQPRYWMGVRTRSLIELADGDLPAARADALQVLQLAKSFETVVCATNADLGRIAFLQHNYREAAQRFDKSYKSLVGLARDYRNVAVNKRYLQSMIVIKNARDISAHMAEAQETGHAADLAADDMQGAVPTEVPKKVPTEMHGEVPTEMHGEGAR